MKNKPIRLILTYIIGLIGGGIFVITSLPLPWILGPLIAILLWKQVSAFPILTSEWLKKISFAITGFQIGGTFTSTTIDSVVPYLLPYTIGTLLLIGISLFNAYLLTKWIPIDVPTSMLGSVPGGLSVIIALSESLKGNAALVTIFHTIRLMTVLFIIPIAATHFFVGNNTNQDYSSLEAEIVQGPLWTVILLVIIFVVSLLLEKIVPAALVIIPMLTVGTAQIIEFPIYLLPDYFYLFAQLTIGIYLGTTIFIKDLMKAGKYCGFYFGLTVILIGISSTFGYLFSLFSNMDLATAILSFAPGGLIEMAITAQTVSGDPSIVSSLQMIRMLIIVLFLPMVLKLLLPKFEKEESKSNTS